MTPGRRWLGVRSPARAMACAATIAACATAIAGEVSPTIVNLAEAGSGQLSQLEVGGLVVTSSNLLNLDGAGVGVVGGTSNAFVDPGESLTVRTDGFPCTHFWLEGQAINGDGDLDPCAALITGITPDGRSTSTQVYVSDASALYVSGIFGGAALTGFSIQPFGNDSIKVTRVSYVRADTFACIDLEASGTFQALSLSNQGITISGSANISVADGTGLGVVGGSFDDRVETGESVQVEFGPKLFTDVCYSVGFASSPNPGAIGEVEVTATGPGGLTMGPVVATFLGGTNVNALFGGSPISAFSISPINGDTIRLAGVCVSGPPVCPGDINHDGSTDVLDFADFLIDFGCDEE